MKFYILVMEGHEISEKYFERLAKGIQEIENAELKRWKAVTPETLSQHSGLNFTKKWKTSGRWFRAPFTETEKSVWYSHLTFWEYVVETNEPAVLMEHDVTLNGKQIYMIEELINYFPYFDFYQMGGNALNAYYITPNYAKGILQTLKKDKLNILENVDGYIHHFRILSSDEYVQNDLHTNFLFTNPNFGKTIEHG